MPKKISDIALAKVPSFANRVSLFQSKLQITRHASGTIADYCHALYKAVAFIGKIPEEFTQADADGYLSYLLSRKPLPAVSQFKHFIYGLKSYLHAMGYPQCDRGQVRVTLTNCLGISFILLLEPPTIILAMFVLLSFTMKLKSDFKEIFQKRPNCT